MNSTFIRTSAGLREAASGGSSLRIFYRDGGGETSTRTVDPLKVYTSGRGLTFLVVLCRLRGAERTFRMDRIESWSITDPEQPHSATPVSPVPPARLTHEHHRAPPVPPAPPSANVYLRSHTEENGPRQNQSASS